jgi:NAD(P)-dependent dehydrogenase (short-subunit alcohol dehydrogenase family)
VALSLVTGAASGIGEAVARALRARGDRVIAADLRAGDIAADLSTQAGRLELIDQAGRLAPDGLDVVVACAGVAAAPPATTIAVNYFGAVATLERLLPLLTRRPGSSAIVITSSAAILPFDPALVEACLSGDEASAKAMAEKSDGQMVYASSKRALSLWMRRTATSSGWAGKRVYLNAIAPGTIKTPMTAPILATEQGRAMLKQATPIAVKDYAEPQAVAEAVVALGGLKSGYVLGQMLFVDGGADAILRTETI